MTTELTKVYVYRHVTIDSLLTMLRVTLSLSVCVCSMAKRKDYSRRRTFQEDADVDYINEHNAKFNKKIKRAYDQYTVEIKQNLERGTAV
jgi:hypothetical protein